MKAVHLLAGAALALTSAWVAAQDAPESLLPKSFEEPSRAPAPRRTPATRPEPRPSPRAAPARSEVPRAAAPRPVSSTAAPTAQSTPVVQALPAGAPAALSPVPALAQDDGTLKRIPSLEELERMSPEDFESLLGTKVLIDTPPAARRSANEAGLLGADEGGLPMDSLASQNGKLIQIALLGNRGMLVSRWGHILLRRALASRLNPPPGISGADFLAMRVALLLRMGEIDAARAVLQDLDIANYTPAFGRVAFDVYSKNADFTGLCPVMATQGSLQDDPAWGVSRTICEAFRGNSTAALSVLERDRNRGTMDQIDLLLAQKYAAAAGKSRRAVTIEWDKVTTLTPWRYGLAVAVGLEPPAPLLADAGPSYDYITALAPAVSLTRRAAAADLAAATGVLSNAAMVDLYSQLYADADTKGEWQSRAENLRDAYTLEDPVARLAAMRTLWKATGAAQYARQVLTAAAAARVAPTAALADDAAALISSMLAAGYDANALRWATVVPSGSQGWGMLVLSAPQGINSVDSSAVDTYVSSDDSARKQRSAFLVAGLAGLGRVNNGVAQRVTADAGMSMDGATRWTKAIDSAAQRGDQASVVLLAAFGMQGDSWQRMTPRYLFHIVSALRQVGLDAEARMIAAEAVSRV
ncbi:hypothetical protein [Novosphingobium sp. Leaf2]|uniref:hypothetical protein n=1 Tax=Novosphingobium sp. Leaf2 TaxID=1735670 RepID=UPI0006FFE094|nr:hypothetical protein [Novosphingobium sp. Leaf2]KQM13810.1 hypothetical protein ASE49_12190 [Novosphingobium sp. Leaf2]